MGKNKKNDVLNLCYDYLAAVDKVLQRITSLFNIKTIWELRADYTLGFYFTKDNVEVVFHGRGVRISENGEEILDIETGMGIDICGIDPWGLYYFVKENILYYSWSDTDEDIKKWLDEELANLLKVGKIKKISNLYFINDEKNRPKLKKYKHNNK